MTNILISIADASAEDIKSSADKINIEPKEKEIYYIFNHRDSGKCKEYNNPYEAIVKYEEEHNVLLREISKDLPEGEYICSLNVAYLYTSNSKMLAKYVEIPNDTFYELDEGNITDEDYPDLFYVRTSTLQGAIEKIITYTGTEEVVEVQRNEDDEEFYYDLIIELRSGKDLIERKYYNLKETKRYKYYFINDEGKVPMYFDSEEEAVQSFERTFNVILTDINKLEPCLALPKEYLVELVCCTQIGQEEKKISSKIFYQSFSSTLTKKMIEKSKDLNDSGEEYFCWNENDLHGFNPGYIIRKFKTEKEAIEYYQRQYNVTLKQTTLTKILASLYDRSKFTLLEHHYTTKVKDKTNLETILDTVNKTYYEKI